MPLVLPDREWPNRTLDRAPRWLSTDLRDGNQALAEPMDPARKLTMFDLLVEMGYKEIEVGFPVASRADHDFVRLLIEQDRIPDDVRISVLVQARDELIERTVESLAGARAATVHIYNATSPQFRDLVLRVSRDECKDLAVQATRYMMKYAERALPGCDLGYQYSPELFNETEPEFALEVCEAVMEVWQPEKGREIILNFPTTVERSMPTVFADQIEYLDRNLSHRGDVCLSVHPHNDRGTAVATAELALLAGAQRVEGTLFGNGERAGNLCLVTLGMNMYTQGVDPGVDFSDLTGVRQTVERCNRIPVHPRHPYGGDLVYTAFSGSHQDAIKKGFDALESTARDLGEYPGDLPWSVPYLPLDPEDVGRTYEAIVRINSQSGKGGIAYVMASRFGLNLPRGLQADLAGHVQERADLTSGELSPELILATFEREYVAAADPSARAEGMPPVVELFVDGARFDISGAAADTVRTIGARLAALNVDVRIVHRTGLAATGRPDGAIAVYAQCTMDDVTFWGAGIDPDVEQAALRSVQAALSRARERAASRDPETGIPEEDELPPMPTSAETSLLARRVTHPPAATATTTARPRRQTKKAKVSDHGTVRA